MRIVGAVVDRVPERCENCRFLAFYTWLDPVVITDEIPRFCRLVNDLSDGEIFFIESEKPEWCPLASSIAQLSARQFERLVIYEIKE